MALTRRMRRFATLLTFTFCALASAPSASSETLPPTIVSAQRGSARTLVGDWEPPDLVVLAYDDTWPQTSRTLLDIVSAVMPVVVVSEEVNLSAARANIERLDPDQQLRSWLYGYAVDSPWTRDYSPLQARSSDGTLVWLDAAYSVDRPRDEHVPLALASSFGTVAEPIEETMDGGALASNGRGLCVSTEEYFEDNEIELGPGSDSTLLEQLGCRVIALVPALAHEDTKHVDLFVQFLAADLAIVARFDPSEDPEDAWRTDRAVAVLRRASASMRQPLVIERIDSPAAVDRQYRSYINLLQLPDFLLVPSYESVDPWIEDAALSTLGRLAPERTVLRIPADAPSNHGGSVHCLTWGLHIPD